MLEIKKVNKYFNKGKKNEIHVINDTTLSLPNSGLIALLGSSGCGKTTLLNVIGGLDRVKNGSIYINNQKITSKSSYKVDRIRNLNVGYIFQDYKLIDQLSVYDNVAISLKTIGIKDKKEIKKRVDYVLDKLNILRYKYRPAEMLSGGERQRVGIARALVKNPDIILADEPTGNLDSKNSLEIMNIIKAISRERLVVLVTHEQDLAKFFADRIVEIVDGKIVKDYKNSNKDQLDYRIDNKFYLKDFEIHEEFKNNNYDIDIYSENNKKINIDIVIKNGNIYIQSNNKEKIEVIDEDSSIELLNSHYKKIEQNDILDYEFDLNKVIDKNVKYKYSSIYNPISLLTSGFKKVFGFSILKKILLIGFFLSGMFIMYSVSSITAISKVNDKDFVLYNSNYLIVNMRNVKVNDFLQYEKKENIDYILPGNSIVEFNVKYNDYYQTSMIHDVLSGSLSSIDLITDKDLLLGKYPANEKEIVIDKLALERMFVNETAKMSGVLDYTYMLNRYIETNTGVKYQIVGITDNNTPSIYTNNSEFINIIASKNFYDSKDIDGTSLNDYNLVIDKIKIVKGHLPKNDYEVIVNNNYEDKYKLNKTIDVKVNGTKLKVVGYYSSKENIIDMYVNNNTIKYNLISTMENFTIYSKVKNEVLLELQKDGLNVVDSYTKSRNDYIKERSEYVKVYLIASLIILVISLIEIFLMLRSSFLSRIKEVGVLRAIGIKKIDIYKMFLGEIIAIIIIASLPGILLMAYILNGLSGISYLCDMYIINLKTIIISIGLVLVFNIIVGLLPVFRVIIKSPARILARHDLD